MTQPGIDVSIEEYQTDRKSGRLKTKKETVRQIIKLDHSNKLFWMAYIMWSTKVEVYAATGHVLHSLAVD